MTPGLRDLQSVLWKCPGNKRDGEKKRKEKQNMAACGLEPSLMLNRFSFFPSFYFWQMFLVYGGLWVRTFSNAQLFPFISSYFLFYNCSYFMAVGSNLPGGSVVSLFYLCFFVTVISFLGEAKPMTTSSMLSFEPGLYFQGTISTLFCFLVRYCVTDVWSSTHQAHKTFAQWLFLPSTRASSASNNKQLVWETSTRWRFSQRLWCTKIYPTV